MYAVLLVALLSLLPRHRGQAPPVVDKENAANAREQQSQSEPQPEESPAVMRVVKDILSILSPIATLAVGLGVAYVAWKQWELAGNRLRLDLFDRRYKVYEAARVFLSAIYSQPRFEDQQLFAFNSGTADAEFFFESDIVDYLSLLRIHALEMRKNGRLSSAAAKGNETAPYDEAERTELSWLTDQSTAITEKFTPYLGFSHIK